MLILKKSILLYFECLGHVSNRFQEALLFLWNDGESLRNTYRVSCLIAYDVWQPYQ